MCTGSELLHAPRSRAPTTSSDQAMSRVLGSAALVLVIVWIIAHLLYLGPIRDAAEVTLAWLVWAAAASGLIAALTTLVFGLLVGRTSPAWLRFVRLSRTVGTVLGSALVVVGLLHYRDTEPRGDLQWIVLGLAVLAGAAIVHGWVVLTSRRIS
jgi:hypothetical protein